MSERPRWPVSAFLAQIGCEIGVSEYFRLDQQRIDDFATVTEDGQFIHTDPDRAARGPFGGTIAHGFLNLSLLSAMQRSCVPEIEGATAQLNYGFDKIRFLNPVRSSARVRARFTLAALSERGKGRWLMALGVVLEIENVDKPALIADWLILVAT